VVADAHGVIVHGRHELKRQFATGQLGQGAGEDVACIEQKREVLFGADMVDKGRQLSDATDVVEIVTLEGGDRVVGAFEIVGVEQGDFAELIRGDVLGRLCATRKRDHHGEDGNDEGSLANAHAR